MMTPEINQLYNDALARFRGRNEPGKTIVLFLHHNIFSEVLTAPIEKRLNFIVRNKPERELPIRLRWIQPYVPSDVHSILKQSAELRRAEAELERAGAEWRSADAEWRRADAKWRRAEAELENMDEADTEWKRTCVGWEKAVTGWKETYTAWEKIFMPIFMAAHPDCPWDGKTLIF